MDNPNIRKVAVVLGAVLVLFVAAKTVSELKEMAYIGKSAYPANVITVSGKGEVMATPDIATFTFTVSEEAASVGAAQEDATEKMNSILAYVSEQGVEEKDVKTVSYNIYPRYEYRGGTAYTSGTRYLAAYVVSQTIEIKVRDLTKAGALLSGIGQFGATDVSGLTFSVDAQDELVRQARAEAIEDAREQAKVLAKSLGVRLGKITSFYENSPYQPYPVYYAKDMAMGGVANEAAAPSLPAGENKVVSNVSVTYEIK